MRGLVLHVHGSRSTESIRLRRALDDAPFEESKHPRDPEGKFTSGGGVGKKGAGAKGSKKAPIAMGEMKKVGEQKGSNPGGVYEAPDGKKYYIKQGKSEVHVANELLAANLLQMAGGKTLNYQPVEGDNHIATEFEKLDVDNASKLTPAEKKKVQETFIANAWIANWDIAGTGGDNLGVVKGQPTALDLGGALMFRAQGEPKGDKFGPKVIEIDTLLDSTLNPDTAKLFAGMTYNDFVKSAKHVTSISDYDVMKAVADAGLPKSLADVLMKRKSNIAAIFHLQNNTSLKPAGGAEPKPEPEVAAGGKGKYGGVYETGGATPKENHALTVAKLMKKPVVAGSNYRSALAQLIKEAPGFGTGPETVAILKSKLGESWWKTGANLMAQAAAEQDPAKSKKLFDDAKKISAKLDELGYKPAHEQAAPAKPEPESTKAKKTTPAPKPLKSVELPPPSAAPKEPEAQISIAEKIKKVAAAAIEAAFGAEQAEPSKPAPQATPEEIAKAKKGTKYPVNAQLPAPAIKAIEEFNAKYEGKELTDPAAINTKVAEFKAMKTLVAEETNKAAAAAQKLAEEKAAAAKQAEKTKYIEQRKALGLTGEHEETYNALKSVVGSSSEKNAIDYINQAKGRLDALQSKGIAKEMSPLEAAHIVAYSGSSYGPVNTALRSGSMTPEQYRFTKGLNSALSKLPSYTEPTMRNAGLTPQQQALYKPGMVIEERGFSSTSKTGEFAKGSNTSYVFKGKSGRDISKLSSHASEQEVLYPSGTWFRVNKVEPLGGGRVRVHLEEF